MIPTDNSDDKQLTDRQLTDGQLIENVITRVQGASDLFVERFYKFIFSILARDLKLPREQAEDLHQDIFLRLFENDFQRLCNWSGDGNFVNYLGTLVRNLANDWFRKKKMRGEVPLDPDSDEDDTPPAVQPASTDPSPEEEAATAERRRRLHQAIEKLSERDRELIHRRHLKEQSYREIAGGMDYKISSVGVILARAERRLKEAVDRRIKERRLALVEH